MLNPRRLGTIAVSISLYFFLILAVGLAAYLAYLRLNHKPFDLLRITPPENVPSGASASMDNPTPVVLPSEIPTFTAESINHISRRALYLTNIPDRPSTEIITYTVQSGDTLFSIAEHFKVKPTTLLWGNFDVLQDNPHLLKPGQILNILPVDGTFYQWKEGDTIEKVASQFKTDPQAIIDFVGNNIDLTKINEPNSGIQPDTWIIVPGGKRAIKDWGPPAITRSNPASARAYGPGSCGEVYEGAVGTGSFVWPTTEHSISGYNYDPGVHPAIDISGQIGNPVFAADSGVVVFAGWSEFGYGNLIVIDHGNGWQSAYAHLNAVGVSCGMSVFRGGAIATLGNTGNSTGPHLHFELIFNGAKVNPIDFVQ